MYRGAKELRALGFGGFRVERVCGFRVVRLRVSSGRVCLYRGVRGKEFAGPKALDK